MIKKRIIPLMDAEKANYIDKGIAIVIKCEEIDIGATGQYDRSDLSGKAIEEFDEIVNGIKYCYDNQLPLMVYDFNVDNVYICNQFGDDSNVTLINSGKNYLQYCVLEYDSENKILNINNGVEGVATEDNVKTLFGNQNIIGQGNIDLYRHNLEIGNGTATVYYTIYSSNNLKCDSLQDLTTVLKPTNLTGKYGWGTGYMIYVNGVWKMTVSGEALSNVTTIHDYVSAI